MSSSRTKGLNITQADFTFIKNSMVQETDNRRPLTAEAQVRCPPSQCGICGGKSGLGQVLLPAFPLSHVSVIRTRGRSLGTFQTLPFWISWSNGQNSTVSLLCCHAGCWDTTPCGLQQRQYRHHNLKSNTIRAVLNSKHKTRSD